MASSVGSVVFSISADIKDIQGQLRQIEGQFSQTANKLSSVAKSIATSIGGVFAVGAINAYIGKIVDLGDQLSDLSDITGLSVETLGGLRVVTEQNGSSLSAFAAGVLKAQKNLGELTDEGKGASLAIKALGLNIDEVRKLSPDAFLETFATALAKVEDRNLRAAIAARVFGKAGVELIPTVLSLAENGIPKLSSETAAAYKKLGEFKDQMVAVSASIADKVAPGLSSLIQLFKELFGLLSENDKKIINLDNVSDRASAVAGQLSASIKQRAIGSRSGIASDAVFERLKKERDDLLEQISSGVSGLSGSKSKGNPGKSLGDFATPKAGGGTDKLKDAIESYTKSLQTAIEKQEEQRIKLQFGEVTALKAAQAFDILALKEKLVADGLKIPPQVATDVAAATATLKSLGVNVDQLSSKDFPKLRDEYLKLAEANEEIAKGVKALDELYANDENVVRERIGLTKEQAAELANLKREYDDLVQSVRIGAIKDPENRRIAGIEVEFAKTAAKIQELGEKTGKSQAEIADAISAAWQKSLGEIQDKTDEVSEFQIEALRKIQDAMAGFIEDALNGNLKGWRAWAEGVRKTMNQVVAQAAAKELNEIFFGTDKKKPIGGIAGQGLDWLKNLFGMGSGGAPMPAGQLPPGPPSVPGPPMIGTSLGGGLAGGDTAAIAAINATASTAGAGIQAESMAAITSIESATTIGATAINAVKEAAIIAIDAASAKGGSSSDSSSSGSSLFGSFGGLLDQAFQPSGESAGGGTTGSLFSTGGDSGMFSLYGSGGAAMANGGRPSRMMPTLVGERGPELFVPDQSGTIVPNGKFSMGGNSVTINVSTPDAASFRASEHQIFSRAAAAIGRSRNR